MPMAASRDKEHSAPNKAVPPEKPTQCETDRIAAALRQLYGRICAEPLPRRLVELLNRLKLRH